MVWLSVCGASLAGSANGGYVDIIVTIVVSLNIVSMVLVLWGVGLIRGNVWGNGYGL